MICPQCHDDQPPIFPLLSHLMITHGLTWREAEDAAIAAYQREREQEVMVL